MTMNEPYNYGQRNKEEQEISIDPRFNTEEVSKSGHNLYKRRRVLDKCTTKNEFQDSKIFDARFYNQKLITIKNTHASNAGKYILLACIDPSQWITLKSETTITAGETVKIDSSDVAQLARPFAFIKIQVASNVADTPATIDAYIAGNN